MDTHKYTEICTICMYVSLYVYVGIYRSLVNCVFPYFASCTGPIQALSGGKKVVEYFPVMAPNLTFQFSDLKILFQLKLKLYGNQYTRILKSTYVHVCIYINNLKGDSSLWKYVFEKIFGAFNNLGSFDVK